MIGSFVRHELCEGHVLPEKCHVGWRMSREICTFAGSKRTLQRLEEAGQIITLT